MEFGGMGGGDGRWNMKDSANSYVQYHLANETSGGKQNWSGKRSDPLTEFVFWACFAVSVITLASSGIDFLLALILALPISAVPTLIILLVITAIGSKLKRKKSPCEKP